MATVTTDTYIGRDVYRGKRSSWMKLQINWADPKYAEVCLKTLGDAILDIYKDNIEGLSYEELYSKAFHLVLHKFGEKLYSSIESTITSLLNEMAVLIKGSTGDLFLEELDRKWTEHNKALQVIRDIFLYMDRTFTPSTHKTPVIELGLNLWRDIIIHTIKIQTRLLELVKIERGGGLMNRGLMKNAVNMLRSFGSSSYQEYFEKPFLVATADFYHGESQLLIESCDCGDYLKKVEKRLNEETERVESYLDPRSKRVLHYVVETHMIESQMNKLVHMENSGLVSMLMGDKYEDLGRMYTLFKRVPDGLSLIKKVMTSHICDTRKQLATDPERIKDPLVFVQCFSDERDKYDKIIKLAFKKDKDFQKELNSSFEHQLLLVKEVMVSHINNTGNRLVTDPGRLKDPVDLVQCFLDEMHNYEDIINIAFFDDEDLQKALDSSFEYGLSLIKKVMTSHIRDTGKQFVTDPERLKDPVDFVQHLLDERDKYDKIINLAFKNDKAFQNALDSAFEYFINLNTCSPELISLFVNDKLQKGFKGVSEEDVEILLDKVITLFRYLQAKDIFEKYYRQHLAKRLFSNKSVSDEAERSLILKLKTECGYQFTSKFERMFSDMKTSEDTMKQFYEAMGPELGDGPTLVVSVLTTGSWPIKSTATCKLPSEIQTVYDEFTAYYLGTYSGRMLTWQTNMGSVDIKATFSKGQEHELYVSTYQMCVLMLFNSVDRLSYREIEQATEIPTSNLKRCLQSLACVKGKNVLMKEPMSKDVGEDDVFFFNDKFSSKFYRVNMGTVVAQKESEAETQETRQRVREDRKFQIEAAIVRIMKVRRVLDHDNIVAEVTEQLKARFLPNPVVIKNRIESLIEREFLERDNDDKKFWYLP